MKGHLRRHGRQNFKEGGGLARDDRKEKGEGGSVGLKITSSSGGKNWRRGAKDQGAEECKENAEKKWVQNKIGGRTGVGGLQRKKGV